MLDIDNRHGGLGNWIEILKLHEIDTDTPRVRTPTGGWHFYYLSDTPVPTTEGVMASGIDTRGGTENGEGRGYVLTAPPPAIRLADTIVGLCSPVRENSKPFPKVLADAITAKKSRNPAKATGQNMAALKKAHSGVNHFASLPQVIPEGTRNPTLARYAYGLVHSVPPEVAEPASQRGKR